MKKLLERLFPGHEIIVPYLIVVYFLMLGTLGFLITKVPEWNAIAAAVVVCAALSYAFLYMVPGMLLTAIVSAATVKAGEARWRRNLALGFAVGAMYLSHLTLLADAGLYHGFGFHFNYLVWNLLITPGGFASMGLRAATVTYLVAGFLLLFLFHLGLLLAFHFAAKIRRISVVLGSWRKYALFGFATVCFLFSMFAYGYEHYMLRPPALTAVDTIPLFQGATMSSLLKKLGVEKPDREVVSLKLSSSSSKSLNYPLKPITRRDDRPKYNVIFLVCESWRADMLDPAIMPNASRFAERAVNFKRNFSGGNGTRVGMFSLFYGLYGNYWDEFLKNRRGPVFIDWLLEDGYRFRCLTSAKFSYPEFDQTVFFRVPTDALHSDDSGRTYTRDQRNVKLLTRFLAEAGDNDAPFMAFMFFESTHAPYEFPPEAVIAEDYLPDLNYATVSPRDRYKIKNRYLNASNHLDQRLGEVFQLLEEKKLYDDTIVVLVGDHGEEFYEKGRLGHNISFVNEQIMTPLAIHIPGVEPAVYTEMSSHLDVIPMLAPFFGVENPPADYSLGFNLLDPAQKRTYSIGADWSQIFYISRQYKTLLPLSSLDYATMKLTDGEDTPLKAMNDTFFREKQAELFKIQRELNIF